MDVRERKDVRPGLTVGIVLRQDRGDTPDSRAVRDLRHAHRRDVCPLRGHWREEALTAGAAECFSKPIEFALLEEILGRYAA